jgi:hypothetical protein
LTSSCKYLKYKKFKYAYILYKKQQIDQVQTCHLGHHVLGHHFHDIFFIGFRSVAGIESGGESDSARHAGMGFGAISAEGGENDGAGDDGRRTWREGRSVGGSSIFWT